jgi:hypothetical protein
VYASRTRRNSSEHRERGLLRVDVRRLLGGAERDLGRLEREPVAEVDAGHLVFTQHRVRRRPLDAIVRAGVERDGDVAFREVEGDLLALDEVVLGERLADGREVLADLRAAAGVAVDDLGRRARLGGEQTDTDREHAGDAHTREKPQSDAEDEPAREPRQHLVKHTTVWGTAHKNLSARGVLCRLTAVSGASGPCPDRPADGPDRTGVLPPGHRRSYFWQCELLPRAFGRSCQNPLYGV